MTHVADIHVAASILAADHSCLGEAVEKAQRAGADSIHIDIMDGHYVHNFTFGLDLFPALRPHTCLPLVAHLEVADPNPFLADLARAGCQMIIVQEDTCPDLALTVETIRGLGLGVGVAVNPDRPLAPVSDLLGRLDLLLCMSVAPGFGGQPFRAEALPKVRAARQMASALPRRPQIGLDGGIGPATIREAIQAGADFLAIGTALFQGGRVRRNLQALRRLIEAAVGPG